MAEKLKGELKEKQTQQHPLIMLALLGNFLFVCQDHSDTNINQQQQVSMPVTQSNQRIRGYYTRFIAEHP